MPIPVFPEAQHSLIKSLAQQSDQALLELFARYPETGQYFVALFCRYTPLIYAGGGAIGPDADSIGLSVRPGLATYLQ
ncbi:MAG: hypothetical protein HC860_08370 [Alkalinema sp. RU_4_3]|nr:hypothetical protein [Alkalinema sp. RU_4_3]